MRYRYGQKADLEGIYQLICRLEKQSFPKEKFAAIFEKQINDANYIFLVGEVHQEIIAVLSIRIEEQLHHCDKMAEILEFCVLESYQNQGVGKDLFKRACDLAKERGCLQIELACHKKRKNAHRFYLSQGMRASHEKFCKTLKEECGI